jgi:Flp pilus assembly protein TadD
MSSQPFTNTRDVSATTMNPAIACMTGISAQEAGNLDEAVAHFAHALTLAPSIIDIRLLLAYALASHNQKTEAQRVLAETPELDTLPESELRRVADAATQTGAVAVALRTVRILAEKSPNDADLQSMLGAMLLRSGEVEAASHVLNRAVLRWPTHVSILMNTARLNVADGNYASALRNYDRVLKSSPKHATARWYRGMLRIKMGDLAGGWTDHEARRTLPVHTVGVPAGIPAWDGKNAAGKTILLWGEQGLGDQIQGVRFAVRLAALGARVIVKCARPLKRLFESVDGVSQVVADGEMIPACDAHVPMLSVPFLLKLFDETAYDSGSYLQHAAGSSLSAISRFHAGEHDNPFRRTRVGFVWAGSPGHINDHNRSLSAAQMQSLVDGTSVQWVSLQVGERAIDLASLPQSRRDDIVNVAPTLVDFVDTAHVLSALDRVVTVDTSVAHLAGAMGVPTLLLTPFVPDWRWGLVREDSPWYPSLSVLRQPSAGDWGSVIARVKRELSAGGTGRLSAA